MSFIESNTNLSQYPGSPYSAYEEALFPITMDNIYMPPLKVNKGTPIKASDKKADRNHLCICGSNKKYKHCCWKDKPKKYVIR